MKKIELHIRPGVKFKIKDSAEMGSFMGFITELEVIQDEGDTVICCPLDDEEEYFPIPKELLLKVFTVIKE